MADGRWQKTAAGSLTAPYGYMETRLNLMMSLRSACALFYYESLLGKVYSWDKRA